MILTATGYGLGTLWIANTCFAYNELMDFIGTASWQELLLLALPMKLRLKDQGNHWKKSLSIDRKIGLIKIFNIMCLAFEVWKGWSKRMNLEELKEDCSQKQKKGIHFIIASIVIWLLLWFSEDICCLIAGYIIQIHIWYCQ